VSNTNWTDENTQAELETLRSAYGQRLASQLASLIELLQTLKHSKNAASLEAAQLLAHRIAGAAGSYGFFEPSELCTELDRELQRHGIAMSQEALENASERLQALRVMH